MNKTDQYCKAHLPVQRCAGGQDIRTLSDIELIAVLLGTGSSGMGVMGLAASLFEKFGGMAGIADAGLRELSAEKGVGMQKAVRLQSAIEAGRRSSSSRTELAAVDSPSKVWKIVYPHIAGLRQEEFRVLVLDNKNRVIKNRAASRGTVSETIVHPREIFRDAIRENGSSIIITHNHPSGVLTPSNEDIGVTKRLCETGRLLGIPLIDHVIVSDRAYLSMKEEGYMQG